MKYKLTYFNITGLAESIRYIFSYAGVEFEDDRIEYDLEKWRAKKDRPLFGTLPLLEVDGKLTHQSVAIARFVGKKAKLVGKDDWENLEIDAIVDTQVDFRLKMGAFFQEQDPEKKAKAKEEFLKETLPFYMSRFEKIVEENGGYFAAGKLTWADFFFVGMLGAFNGIVGVDIIDGYHNLQELKNKVENLPGVTEWIEKRPKTQF
uniref:glutathione transferase n=1 Tax=Lasioderma serricorne TaxID=295660 RepID=A0A8F2PYX2_9COLE|nr:glutathione S-transferase sigma 4 [Lasioderma serricorne]